MKKDLPFDLWEKMWDGVILVTSPLTINSVIIVLIGMAFLLCIMPVLRAIWDYRWDVYVGAITGVATLVKICVFVWAAIYTRVLFDPHNEQKHVRHFIITNKYDATEWIMHHCVERFANKEAIN